MSAKKSPFQQIDEAIFRGIDQLKTQPPYQKFQEAISKLSEQQQKAVNLSLSYLLLALPLILVITIFAMNSSLRSTIADKKAIQDEIQKFNDRRAESDVKGRELIVPAPIAAQSELQGKISQLLGRVRIPTTSVNVRSFNEGRVAGDLREYSAELIFDKLSTKQFTDLIKQLEERERMRVSGLLIENRIDQSILKGRMTLAFITQTQQ